MLAPAQRLVVFLYALLSPALAASQQPHSADSLELVLQPGDLIEIEIWREEDLSGEFLIGENGAVTLPLLGQVPVAGTPMAEVRDQLLTRYSRELRNPSVIVTPRRRVYVLGEVNEPGLYQVDPTITLAGAIALAGGPSPQGDIRRLRVVRDGEVIREGVAARGSLATVDVRSGDQIYVDRRGWFDRNSTFLVSAMISVTSIVISLLR